MRIPHVWTDAHGAIHKPSSTARSVVPKSPTSRERHLSATWQRAKTTSSPRMIETQREHV
jgi:hypothetical protein